MKYPSTAIFVSLLASVSLAAHAADISGTWKATFDTQMGQQNYTYELIVVDGKVSGTATGGFGSSALKQGAVNGDTVTFVETMDFQGMPIEVTYTGKIVSADEIDFTRQVGTFATEMLVAKRNPGKT